LGFFYPLFLWVCLYESMNMIDEDENIEDEEKEKKLGVGGTS